jgi:hypothetical protein
VQVEEIEKPPFEINDNTDDVLEPRPAAIQPAPYPQTTRRSTERQTLRDSFDKAQPYPMPKNAPPMHHQQLMNNGR